jgi:predicted O-methyltransferase YrrM
MSPNRYDEIAYPTEAYRQTYPDRLATAGALMGMTPPPVDRCRVLELGGGSGTNLLSMALSLPGAEFVGIDSAASRVAQAREAAQMWGLRNITFLERDLLDEVADLGRFDYVVAHGVYSWTPPDVRDRVLAICDETLAEQGVAFVSYTVYPGAYHRRIAREILLQHAPDTMSPREQLDRARDLLTFLADAMPRPERYRDIFRHERDLLDRLGEGHYLHDNLCAHESVYFREFVAHAGRHGLRYLGDSAVSRSMRGLYPPAAIDKLNQLAPDRLAREQYRDVLDGRLFRETLLCREGVTIADEPLPERVQEVYVTSPVQKAAAAPGSAPSSATFQMPGGAPIRVDHPLAAAALGALSEEGLAGLSFHELLARAQARLPAAAAQELAEVLLITEGAGLVDLTVHRPRFVTVVSDRPAGSPLTRWQISRGKPTTNVWHCPVPLDDPVSRHLFALLDGTRDRAALVEGLAAHMEQQQHFPRRDHAVIREPAELRRLLSDSLDANLERFASWCLLVA